MKKIILLPIYFLVLGFFLVSHARALNFPPPIGFVNDFANLLTPEVKERLETQLVALEKEKAVEFTVVTVPSLEGTTIEDYGVRLFAAWQIGKKGQDNGLLLLVAPNERRVRFEVGYGLEPVLTDASTGRILDNYVLPKFKEGQYAAGIEAGVAAALQALAGEAGATNPPPASGPSAWRWFFENLPLSLIFPLIFLQYLASFLARSQSFWAGGVLGILSGGVLGWLLHSLLWGLTAAGVLGALGLLLDYLLSRNYTHLQKLGRSTSFWRTFGGFAGGGALRSGWGGFGGGHSGGGGSSRSW